MAKKEAKNPGNVIVSKGIYYWSDYNDAVAAGKRILPDEWHQHMKVRNYQKGFAVQIHNSGSYLGPNFNGYNHECPWCPTLKIGDKGVLRTNHTRLAHFS